MKSGKTKRKGWKRMVTKVTFVDDNFTRKPPKFERFIRPMGLRMKKAHVTHPELKATFCVPIIGVKKNPSSPMYTNLGVITKVSANDVTLLDTQCNSVCRGPCWRSTSVSWAWSPVGARWCGASTPRSPTTRRMTAVSTPSFSSITNYYTL